MLLTARKLVKIIVPVMFFVVFFSLTPVSITNHDVALTVAHAAEGDSSTLSLLGSAVSWAFSNTIGALFSTLFGWLLYIPVFLAGAYLYLAGGLFDWLLNNTILEFSSMYAKYFGHGVDSIA